MALSQTRMRMLSLVVSAYLVNAAHGGSNQSSVRDRLTNLSNLSNQRVLQHTAAVQPSHLYQNGSTQHGTAGGSFLQSTALFSYYLEDAPAPGTLEADLVANSPPQHKPLLPLSADDWLGFLAVAVALFVAAGGGLGGGGVLVPVYLLLLKFSLEHAVALSNITVVGGAIANLAYNMPRRHPTLDKPLIDWDIILVMEPATILGALVGGFLNKTLPVWMTSLLLTLLLACISWQLFVKGLTMFRKESASRQSGPALQQPLLNEHGSESSAASSTEVVQSGEHSDGDIHVAVRSLSASSTLKWRDGDLGTPGSADAEHQPQVPWGKLVVLVILFAGVVLSDEVREMLDCGTVRYWVVVFALVPFVLLISWCVRDYLLRRYRAKQLLQRQAAPGAPLRIGGEIEWSDRNTLMYPAICSSAGLVAGLFGIGGGIVKAPLMLAMGVLPEVTAATSATMILFTASSASAVFISFGGICWDYAGALFVIGLVVTFCGQCTTQWIMKHFQRRSVIVFAMAAMLGISLAFMTFQSYQALSYALHHHAMWHWGRLCT